MKSRFQINYDASKDVFEIKDDLKNQHFMMKMLMVLNLVNACLRLFNIADMSFDFMEIIWLVVGIISLIILYFFIFKKSASETIRTDDIKRLKKTSFLGRTRMSLILHNGKQRDLPGLKDAEAFASLKSHLAAQGIPVS